MGLFGDVLAPVQKCVWRAHLVIEYFSYVIYIILIMLKQKSCKSKDILHLLWILKLIKNIDNRLINLPLFQKIYNLWNYFRNLLFLLLFNWLAHFFIELILNNLTLPNWLFIALLLILRISQYKLFQNIKLIIELFNLIKPTK